jgi:predicted porin
MKKSLFAIAAATAFAGAAQAQSSVSVYGIYDGGFSHTKTDETSSSNVKLGAQGGGFTGGESASSRIGFRGTEDLGKGLTANFNLELGFTAGTGEVTTATSSNTANTTGATQGSDTGIRTAIVGLGSKELGTLQIGRQLTGIHSIVAGDVWGGNNMAGDLTYSDIKATSYGAANTVSGRVSSVATRSSNMLTYVSPRIMGLTLRADVGNTTSTALNTNNYVSSPGIQFSVKGAYATYNYGAFTVKAGTVSIASNEAISTGVAFAGTRTTINAANAMYRDKGLTVQYTFASNKTENAITSVYTSGVRAQKLSASYQMGAVMPFVQYGVGNTQGTRSASTANTSTEDSAVQVGVEYSLSKRTNLYAAYGKSDRKVVNSTAKTEVTDTAVGIRHTF